MRELPPERLLDERPPADRPPEERPPERLLPPRRDPPDERLLDLRLEPDLRLDPDLLREDDDRRDEPPDRPPDRERELPPRDDFFDVAMSLLPCEEVGAAANGMLRAQPTQDSRTDGETHGAPDGGE